MILESAEKIHYSLHRWTQEGAATPTNTILEPHSRKLLPQWQWVTINRNMTGGGGGGGGGAIHNFTYIFNFAVALRD